MSTEVLIRPFFLTSIGKKYVMGFSALIWSGFVLTHMAGNLLMFVSGDAYNAYGHALTSGKIILVAEAVLILALIAHVVCAISLTLENRRARGPARYAVSSKTSKAASLASRTMAVQGSLILVFIILHIATFKFGTYYETEVHGEKMRDLFRLMVEVFASPGYVAWYCVAVIILGFHLSHGVGSIFQSFGLKNARTQPMINKISIAYAIIVAGGFLAQPLYVLLFAQ